jgi:two-component system NtrC family response regulator
LLAHAFAQRFAPDRRLRFSPDADAAVSAWTWPGNVRELENRVKRACIMVEGQQISAQDLELQDQAQAAKPMPINLKQARDDAELVAVTRALASSQNNLAQAARLLGISRPTLYNLLEKFQINHHDS